MDQYNNSYSYLNSQQYQQDNQSQGQQNSNNGSIISRVRQQLEQRGARTIRGLGRVFRQLDSFDGNKRVDRNEFFVGLKECGVQLTQEEANQLLQQLDTNQDGYLDFEEFLVGIRGSPNKCRQDIINQAFAKLDKDNSGSISAADLKGVFNCSAHPKVAKGEMTEEQVFLEFLQNFGDSNRDGTITKSEWDDYYAAVSSSIDNDQHFVELMKTAWNL
ncbi:hypothetical protein PPERSA_01151 [Pseudocohnilembus persalinus]|uniref:EF-hand domain-containing protein n=1 Tax=Pseudocohnilembus persalinus TaxID=266149 RepID=A0A0V0QUM7_PSEPJ|nr:hypothetical protein PPERSA_01151 [Pseudocohnilembus persalinus]|eukprot:KRX06073.1 hypothetical protein PPERSA_01151 [Pseudocohnilembus persalinus]